MVTKNTENIEKLAHNMINNMFNNIRTMVKICHVDDPEILDIIIHQAIVQLEIRLTEAMKYHLTQQENQNMATTQEVLERVALEKAIQNLKPISEQQRKAKVAIVKHIARLEAKLMKAMKYHPSQRYTIE